MYDRLVSLVDRLDWPVLTLEMRRAKRSSKSFLYFLVAAALLSFAALFVSVADLERSTKSVLVMIAVMLVQLLRGLFVLAAVSEYGARCIAGEREMQRFENLAMTPMQSHEIIAQKAAMPVLYTFAIAVVTLPADLIWPRVWADPAFIFGGPYGWLALWFVAFSMLVLSVCILCSCLCSKARYASTLSAVVLVCLFLVGNPVFYLMNIGPWAFLFLLILALVFLVLADYRLEGLRRSC